MKVASWPLGYIMLAAGDGRTFMLTESLAIALFAAFVWMGLPIIGVQATGLAFLAMYVLHLPLMYWLARRRTGFGWTRQLKFHFGSLLLLASLICFLGLSSEKLAALMGLFAAFLTGLYAISRLAHMTESSGALGRFALFVKAAMARLGVRHE